MAQDLMTWALPRLHRLLPLDDESLREVITYAESLSKEAGADHLKNMLGDSPQVYEFIADFNARRQTASSRAPLSQPGPRAHARADDDGVPKQGRKQPKHKAPLHTAGPVRRPEGYGDVSSGYMKQTNHEEGSRGPGPSQVSSGPSIADGISLSQQPAALQVPQGRQGGLQTPSPRPSRDASPGTGGTPSLLPPSAAGKLISDLPNVRTKQGKKAAHGPHGPSPAQSQSGTSTPRDARDKGTAATTSSIADLTAAIAALELSTNPTRSTERRRCDCNASVHPLFTTAPNCLTCGKIICALEGLQPCAFCDAPILSREQVSSMIRALKDERGMEKMADHNARIAGSKSGGGTPMFSSPDVSGDEGAGGAAARARAHRDRLLAFQTANAQRIQVHDEAADFDVALTPGMSQWMTPMQRAAALKRQQAYLRELQEMSRPEWEKQTTVMSMSVRHGKLVKTYERVQVDRPQPPADEAELAADAAPSEGKRPVLAGGGAFRHNPLLVGGQLIRPVWTPSEGADGGGERTTTARKSGWRRVQDDHDDNEQWILDGGVRGFGAAARVTDDGSRQESG